ncbi:MAG: MTH938/NDUFAF3 family protein [Halanaerobiales bacterium]
MQIDNYSFGEIEINGKKYKSDLIIFPEKIHANWWRKQGHLLVREDIEDVISYKPEIFIIGTGKYNLMKIPDRLKDELNKLEFELFIAKTDRAVKKFNDVEGKKVAALHLTC